MGNSLFTAVTGLRTNQEMLDVVGNNLANSNTTGFKSQSVVFSDLVYQTLSPGTSSSSNTVGGTNPMQVGLGTQIAAINADNSQGSLEATGRDLDFAIQGNGYFVARSGTQDFYTRAGSFNIDSDNYLVDPATGDRIQRYGTVGEGSATSPAFQTSGNNDISIPIGTGIPGHATDNVVLQGNLTANAVGPLAQSLASAQPYQAGGAAATTATLLNSLDGTTTPYAAGDQLTLQGVDAAGNAVNASIPVGPASTLGDVVSAINADFPGSTASIDANGNLMMQNNSTGTSTLNFSLNDAATNTGGSTWANHTMNTTTVGKDGDTVKTGIQVYDSQGTAHTMNLVFTKQANNTWDLSANVNAADGTMIDNLASNLTFNADGSFNQATGTGVGNPSMSVQFAGFAAPQTINFSFGTAGAFNGLTQVGGASSAVATGQDGFAAGSLTSLAVDQDGVINGVFTNGQTIPIAQMAVASFANPAALSRQGDNYYSISTESGPALINAGLAGGNGSIQQKTLESSNVDVSLEFTRLIIAQRGYQVNARVITASDQVLQELANILQ